VRAHPVLSARNQSAAAPNPSKLPSTAGTDVRVSSCESTAGVCMRRRCLLPKRSRRSFCCRSSSSSGFRRRNTISDGRADVGWKDLRVKAIFVLSSLNSTQSPCQEEILLWFGRKILRAKKIAADSRLHNEEECIVLRLAFNLVRVLPYPLQLRRTWRQRKEPSLARVHAVLLLTSRKPGVPSP